MFRPSYDPIFWYDASAPYVEGRTRKRVKRQVKASKGTALLNWLAIGATLTLLALASCTTARNAPKVKPQHHNAKPRGLGWRVHDARNEASR